MTRDEKIAYLQEKVQAHLKRVNDAMPDLRKEAPLVTAQELMNAVKFEPVSRRNATDIL
jgi:hypothetical protein